MIEGGYKPKDKIFKKKKSEFGVIRRGERIIGNLEFSASRLGNEMWTLEAEERK